MFSEKLRETRKLKKLTQSQLASLLNISVTTYGDYERGRTEPDLKCLRKMAKLLDVSVDYLLEVERNTDIEYVKVKKEKMDQLLNLVLDITKKWWS